MLASTAAEAPRGEQWTYEPKYDGVRVLAIVEPAPSRAQPRVWLLTRNGNDKAAQFPAVATALLALARGRRHTLVLDGEIVALDAAGNPARFEALQHRIHARERRAAATDAAFVAFDCLADGRTALSTELCAPLAAQPWHARRRRLEALLVGEVDDQGPLRLAPTTPELAPILHRARVAGWEGLIAKDREAPYACGQRSASWRKVKLEHQQELVVGGWTEPRGGRPHIGALLLGHWAPDGRLVYAGAVGAGMSHAQLARLALMLKPLERRTSPFDEAPVLEGAHWVTPRVVVEVRFSEWTRGGRLRQPRFLGVRDDKPARLVVREPDGAAAAGGETPAPRPIAAAPHAAITWPIDHARICARLEEIERDAPDATGDVDVGERVTLRVTHLARPVVGAPRARAGGRGARQAVVTKGALMRYYVRMAPVLLPALRDRPLVLRRHTGTLGDDGLPAGGFYQQHVGGTVPRGVRTAKVGDDPERRYVGGNLPTLLHLVQLGTISMDPWHARIGSLDTPDYTILDLDPMPEAPFARVVDVALHVREALDALGLVAAVKTSGASGMHIVVPLPPGVPALAARLLAEVVATRVATRHPRLATVTRSVRARAADAVYVDFLQNVTGKSVAAVYSARASLGAGVSTPLDWDEVRPGLDPRDFTVRTVPRRVMRDGDRWAAAMARGNAVEALDGLSRLARDWKAAAR